MVKEKTVQSLAIEMYDAIVWDTRDNGKKFAKLSDGSPQWMTDVIRAAHGDKMPDNTVYEFIERAVNAIQDHDEPQDAIAEIESDSYTADLTAWLNARVDHVYYLTQALEDFGPFDDGFKLLAYAQSIQIQEVAGIVLAELEKLVEGNDNAHL